MSEENRTQRELLQTFLHEAQVSRPEEIIAALGEENPDKLAGIFAAMNFIGINNSAVMQIIAKLSAEQASAIIVAMDAISSDSRPSDLMESLQAITEKLKRENDVWQKKQTRVKRVVALLESLRARNSKKFEEIVEHLKKSESELAMIVQTYLESKQPKAAVPETAAASATRTEEDLWDAARKDLEEQTGRKMGSSAPNPKIKALIERADRTSSLISELPLNLSVRLGGTKLTYAQLERLKSGSNLELDKSVGKTLEIYLNGQLCAHGTLVAIDDHFGVRVTELVGQEGGNHD